MIDKLIFPATHLTAMLAHLQANLPDEACGLLAGRAGRVTHVLAADNISPRPRLEYEMDPRQQLQHFELMDQQGLEMVGIFHSHPTSPAYPSATDMARAFYPDAVYVIVSLMNAERPEIKGFLLNPDNGQIRDVEILVENASLEL